MIIDYYHAFFLAIVFSLMTRGEKKIGEFQLSNTLFASGAPIVVPSFCVCMRVIRRRGKKTAKEKK